MKGGRGFVAAASVVLQQQHIKKKKAGGPLGTSSDRPRADTGEKSQVREQQSGLRRLANTRPSTPRHIWFLPRCSRVFSG